MAVIELLQTCWKNVLVTRTTALSVSQLPSGITRWLRSTGWAIQPSATRTSPAYKSQCVQRCRQCSQHIFSPNRWSVNVVMLNLGTGRISLQTSIQTRYLWGSIQLILVWDLRQLRPVPNYLYNGEGKSCFESPIWKRMDIHVEMLQQPVRHNETFLWSNQATTARKHFLNLHRKDFQYKPNLNEITPFAFVPKK